MANETPPPILKYIPELNAFFDPDTNTYRDMHGYIFNPSLPEKKSILSEDSLISTKLTAILILASASAVGYFYMMQSKIDTTVAELTLVKHDVNSNIDSTNRRIDILDKQVSRLNDTIDMQTDLLRNLQNTMNDMLRNNRMKRGQ